MSYTSQLGLPNHESHVFVPVDAAFDPAAIAPAELIDPEGTHWILTEP